MKKPAKHLSQPEREAVVDLLHLCMYADAHLSIRESKFISDVVETLGWDQKLSFSGYETRSIAAVRNARGDDVALKKFIEGAGARLKSKESRQEAFSLCTDLTASDGTDPKESRLLQLIRTTLL